MYKFDNAEIEKEQTTLHIPKDCYFYLTGHFQFEVLKGDVYVNGIKALKGNHCIEQSHFSPAIPFVCKTNADIQFKPLTTTCEELYELPNSYLMKETTKEDTLLSSNAFTFGGIRIVNKSLANKMNIPKNWRKVIQRIKNTAKQGVVRVGVVGGKGCGKSTFVNLLKNSLVEDNKVCIIDVDPGQPFCGKIGTFSLIICDKQNFNEPYISKTFYEEYNFVIGSNNLGNNTCLVIQTIKELIQLYIDKYSNLPLIINTAGWKSGFGLELLELELSLSRTMFVIDIIDSPNSIIKELDQICPIHIAIQSGVNKSFILPNLLTSSFRRDLSLSNLMIHSNWYSIPLKRISLSYLDDFDPHFALLSINNKYVFLSHNNLIEPHIINNTTDYPVFYKPDNKSALSTFGIGLVLINVTSKTLYIKTSIGDDKMKDVNTIIYSVFMDSPIMHPIVDGEIGPYMALDQDISGSERSQFKFIRRNFD
ncbi:hypothetical protein EHI8A_212670 [Entamoeba histolytica HM-1:IMSS-B]|uniref:Clp1 P-loop domain-containing protein n=7 Tax=Entamoeba histolytica TaxID=5759 RepID=C4M7D2_ENTH1|nr:hypothetical protein EHI_011190 [Entamoeba histolytica HM-1:IMSS]EMD42969.1 Hypothetical protein EHI5A_134560 [Entamoeba histolytica KU27]EMH72983.1 hypothetical protein EHI8A_212670 [Entamoeba histolytica HM-1:IMSS-B]EMS14740.1 hypothetical protein KM1_174680 [Entamoeba histolytica HM-3:IMSS]ENY65412.1 hypothetical protein EHI7A_183160 [Entamoeba histolytica HM-1:IMSS-A]GAT97436.1 hypothetical protein CL6EHI_011190 [Entamoeba histolytica]|eukprot:XP_651867.1 hypothetical protein EHI_011190 [Entamoeba histolytica HM-1:IMSS]